MAKKRRVTNAGSLVPVAMPLAAGLQPSFADVVALIQRTRERVFEAVNTALLDLYWQVGAYISRKVESAAWGEGVVEQLADYIRRQHSDLKGFTPPVLPGVS